MIYDYVLTTIPDTLKYNTKFPQMKKADVNGDNALPIFTYLKEQKGFEGFGKGPKALAMGLMLSGIDKDYKNTPRTEPTRAWRS